MTLDTTELRRLHGAATAGEWRHNFTTKDELCVYSADDDANNNEVIAVMDGCDLHANAAAIVALHNAALGLFDDRDRLARIEAVMASDEAVEVLAGAYCNTHGTMGTIATAALAALRELIGEKK